MTSRGLFIDGTQTDASGGAGCSIRDPATGGGSARRGRGGEATPGVPPPSNYTAGAADKSHGQPTPAQAQGTLLPFREPIGVCAAITPWNFPMVILGWKVAPALAMGNSVVVKPAEVTPLSALALADLAVEAGVPPGVLNVVPGKGSEAGEALVRHPLVRKIAFTGSTEVGTRVMQQAAQGIKRQPLEHRGQSASLVLAQPGPGGAGSLRRVRRAVRRPGEGSARRRYRRRVHRDGPTHHPGAPAEGGGPH